MSERNVSNESPNPEPPASPSRIEAKPATDPLVRLLAAMAMFLGFAIYCAVDAEDPPAAWDLQHINEASSYALHVGGPFVFGIIGLVLAGMAIRFVRRRLVADETGLGYLGREKIAWDAITEIDAKTLQSKGILKLRHHPDKTLTLDSWKLTNFRELVALVERKVPADRMKT